MFSRVFIVYGIHGILLAGTDSKKRKKTYLRPQNNWYSTKNKSFWYLSKQKQRLPTYYYFDTIIVRQFLRVIIKMYVYTCI